MPDSFVQVPVDGVGKKMRARERVIGGNTVYEPYNVVGAMPTYYFQTTLVTGAANKHWMDIWNATGSGVVLRLKKLFIQSGVTAVTGGANTFTIDRTSAIGTGGTVITPALVDTADPALPAQVTARQHNTGGATVAQQLFNMTLSSEETLPGAHFNWAFNAIPEGLEIREPAIREGQGLRVFQTAFVAGLWSVLAVLTLD